jgi:hypothetical protein
MLKSSLKSVPASRIIAGILVGIAALLFFFGNVMIIMRAGILTTPVYAGDEYGHWANARFFASGLAREQFDPFLPSLHSYLYFFITRWLTLSPEGPAAMRLLNYLFIGITAALVWGLARALVSRPLALLASGLVFSLGSTTWAAAVMPETMYTCIIVGVAVFMVRVWSPDRSPDSFVAGAMIGALMLVKPHGVAILLSTALTIVAVPVLLHGRRGVVSSAVKNLVSLAGGAAVSIALLSSLAQGRLVISPMIFVGDYDRYLADGGSTWAALLNVARYFSVHLIVLLLFFAPAIIAAPPMVRVLIADNRVMPGTAVKLESLFRLIVFSIFAALSVFAMVSVFTHKVGAGNAFEANRIHGRYWCFLFPLLIVITIAFFQFAKLGDEIRPKVSRWLERVAGLGWLSAILIFGVWVSAVFSLFPWDFPELFALYRPINPNWGTTAWVPYSFTIVMALLSVCALAYLFRIPGRRLCYVVSLAITLIIGNLNTTGWQLEIMPNMRPLVDAGQATTRIVGRQSEGLFVTPEYWGWPMYLLFQLPLRSVVAIKPTTAVLTDADLPTSARWVVTASPYRVEFHYTIAVPFTSVTLYLRGSQP